MFDLLFLLNFPDVYKIHVFWCYRKSHEIRPAPVVQKRNTSLVVVRLLGSLLQDWQCKLVNASLSYIIPEKISFCILYLIQLTKHERETHT